MIEIHARAKKNISLAYKRKSGKIGHCYIDPSKPLKWKRSETAYPGDPGIAYLLATKDEVLVSVFKQVGKAEIYVKPCNLFFQSEKRGAIVKVLYGQK